jgi:hypothetical protein
MELQHWAVAQLTASQAALQALAAAFAPDEYDWRPSADQWSAREVAAHLLDEERLDFRRRLELTLLQPAEPLPPIDPQAWLVAHGYAARDFHATLAALAAERAASLAWLAALPPSDWQRPLNHPVLHDLTAGDLLCSWVAHDLLHLRQLTELRYALTALRSGFRPAYAGDW